MAREYDSRFQSGEQSAYRAYYDAPGAIPYNGDVGDDDDDDEGPTPLEYARSIGFCRDFMLDHPFELCSSSSLPWSNEDDFDDPVGATRVENMSIDGLLVEKLTSSTEAALFLQKVVLVDEKRLMLEDIPDFTPRKSLRVQLPLLRTDHEADMKAFCRRRDEFALDEVKLPPEFVDVEKDEGLEWPEHMRDLPMKIKAELEVERLEVPKDVLPSLHLLAYGEPDLYEYACVREGVEEYQKPSLKMSISPPLMPVISPPLAPFDPSSDTAELPLLSDDADSVAIEADKLNQIIQEHDRVEAPNFDPSDRPDLMDVNNLTRMYTPLHSDLNSSISPPLPKRKLDDLTVQVPLLASDTSSSCTSSKKFKNVSFGEQLTAFVPEHAPTRPLHELDTASEESLNAFFKEVIEPAALKIEQDGRHDQLLPADIEIAVPKMDFEIPTAPWETNYDAVSLKARLANLSDAWKERRQHLENDLKENKDLAHWTITAKSERQLQPYPFDANLGKVPPEPAVDDARYLAVIMSDLSLEDVVVSDALVWKPEGLRVMDRYDEEFEDEFEPEEEDNDQGFENQGRPDEDVSAPVLPQKRPAIDEISKMAKHMMLEREGLNLQDKAGAMFFGSGFNSTNNLHNFMRSMGQQVEVNTLQGKTEATTKSLETKKTTRECFTEPQKHATEGIECHYAPNTARKDAHKLPLGQDASTSHRDESQTLARPHEVQVPFDTPPLPSALPPRAVVLSLTLLQTHRSILRIVFRDLYPNAGHVERDFSTINDAPEADILISPGTGLILTILQKLKQKSLPGQTEQLNGVRDRINKLSRRYERLVVLVGGAISSDVGEMDPRDCEAIAEFMAFCAECRAEVLVRLMADVEGSMARWIAAAVLEYGDTGQEMVLLPEETMWEQVLRRTGLNAYAAQTILACLKASQPTGPFGIRAFVQMRPEQRLEAFAGLLRGRRVLMNVNRALEQKWLSAKTGFR